MARKRANAVDSIWSLGFSSRGKIADTEFKGGMTSKLFLSKHNTGPRSTIMYSATLALKHLLDGQITAWLTPKNEIMCQKGKTEDENIVVWDYKTLKVGKFERGRQVADTEHFAKKGDKGGFVHPILFAPFIVGKLLPTSPAYDTEFTQAFETLKTKGFDVEDQESLQAAFLANDNLYFTRSQYDFRASNIDLLGMKPTFQTFLAPQLGLKGDADSAVSANSKNELLERLKEYRFEGFVPHGEDARLIPKFDLDTMEITAETEFLARLVKGEINSKRPINNILLYGEAGTGKSTMAKLLAQIWGLPYEVLNLSRDTTTKELIGAFQPDGKGGFVSNLPALVRRVKYGGVIEIAELNYAYANALGCLNTLMDDRQELTIHDGTVIPRHPMCIIIGTTNVNYAGCQKINAAFKDRFYRICKVERMPKHQMIEIILHGSGLDNSRRALVAKLVDAAERINDKINEEEIDDAVCSLRGLIEWARDIRYGLSPVAAARTTILPKVSFDEEIQKEIEDMILIPMFGA